MMSLKGRYDEVEGIALQAIRAKLAEGERDQSELEYAAWKEINRITLGMFDDKGGGRSAIQNLIQRTLQNVLSE